MSMTKKYMIATPEQKTKTKDYPDTQRRASHSSVEIGHEVLAQQDKTRKLCTAFNPNPFKVVSKNGNSLMRKSPTGKQCSKNTNHLKQYLNDPTPQQEPDVLTTPASLPTEVPATGLLDSEGCLDLQENIGAKSETPCTSRPQRIRD